MLFWSGLSSSFIRELIDIHWMHRSAESHNTTWFWRCTHHGLRASVRNTGVKSYKDVNAIQLQGPYLNATESLRHEPEQPGADLSEGMGKHISRFPPI